VKEDITEKKRMGAELDRYRHHLEDLVQARTTELRRQSHALQALIDNLPAEKKPQDAEQLARELVRQKKLTAYQAQQIYAGKGKTLVLGNYLILDKLGQGGMGLASSNPPFAAT
jgi:hypothetical protein